MSLALVVTAISAFGSVALLGWFLLSGSSGHRRDIQRSISQLSAYEVRALAEPLPTLLPFVDRVVGPFLNGLVSFLKRVSPAGRAEHMRHRLTLAGNPQGMNADKFLTLKLLAALVMGALVFLFTLASGFSFGRFLISALLMGAAGFFLPDLWLRNLIEKRQKAIRLALPDCLDLLTISVEAGLGFDAALAKVIKHIGGPLAGEFARMLQEMQVGVSRREALRSLSSRTDVEELRSFVTSMVQADIFGVSIARVLRTQAAEMRVQRRQRAEEKAQKAPVKLVFPVVICIFPAIITVILGPGMVRMIMVFSQMQ